MAVFGEDVIFRLCGRKIAQCATFVRPCGRTKVANWAILRPSGTENNTERFSGQNRGRSGEFECQKSLFSYTKLNNNNSYDIAIVCLQKAHFASRNDKVYNTSLRKYNRKLNKSVSHW